MDKTRRAALSRLLPVLLLSALCLSAVGCGRGKGSPDDAQPQPSAAVETVSAVAIGGKEYGPDTTELTAVLSEGDTALLDRLPALRTADLSGSENVREIAAWAAMHPGVDVTWTVRLPDGGVLDSRAESADLSAYDGPALRQAAEALSLLPKLRRVELGAERAGLDWDSIALLRAALPTQVFSYGFDLYGTECDLENTRISLCHVPVDDDGVLLERVMALMPRLSYVDLDSCELPMWRCEEINLKHPDVKVVFRVWFGDNYTVRTDTEKILWAVSVIFLIFQILLDIITREIIHQYQLAMDALALDVADVDGVFGHILSATKIKGALAPRAEVARARSESLIRLSYLNRIEDRLDEVTDGALLIPVGKKTMTRRRIEKTIQEGVKEAQEILEKEKLPEFLSQFDALADGRPLPMPLAEQLQANSYAIHNVGNPDVSLNPATVLYTLAGLTIFVKNHLEEEGEPDYGYDAFFLDLINAAVIEDYAALPAKPAEEKRHRIPFFGKKSEHEEMHGVFKRIQKRFAKGKEAKKETPKPSEETEQNQAK